MVLQWLKYSLVNGCLLLKHRVCCTSFACSGNENTGHSPNVSGDTSYDISTPVARIEPPNATVSWSNF